MSVCQTIVATRRARRYSRLAYLTRSRRRVSISRRIGAMSFDTVETFGGVIVGAGAPGADVADDADYAKKNLVFVDGG